jgi:5-methylcytosine-specific restriction endonuclease McrA
LNSRYKKRAEVESGFPYETNQPSRHRANTASLRTFYQCRWRAFIVMTKQDYASERKDPRWQRKRLEIMQRDGFACSNCRSAKNTLHVHHRYYVKNRPCWAYPDFALVALCDGCHAIEHDESSRGEDHEWEQICGMVLEKYISGNRWDCWEFAHQVRAMLHAGRSYEELMDLIVGQPST